MSQQNNSELFSRENLVNPRTYPEFMALMEQVVSENRTTGPKQSEFYAYYTKLNLTRLLRMNKTFRLNPEAATAARSIQTPQDWFVLTEAWCGDAAYSLPIMAAMADLNPNIRLTLLLRDENLPIMDEYLTQGARSIPKLIARSKNGEDLFNWGPKPAGALELFRTLKSDPSMQPEKIAEEIQRWYIKDKSVSIQKELTELVKESAQQG